MVKKRASAIRCIVEAFDLQKGMLFGSYAYGAPAPDGEVDLSYRNFHFLSDQTHIAIPTMCAAADRHT